MTTTIKATCPICGECELRPPDLRAVCFTQGGGDFYEFTCPQCSDQVRKPADDHVIALLRSGGVKLDVVERPAEALEARSGPPISHDDVLDFALAMRHVDYLTEIIAP